MMIIKMDFFRNKKSLGHSLISLMKTKIKSNMLYQMSLGMIKMAIELLLIRSSYLFFNKGQLCGLTTFWGNVHTKTS